MDATTATYLLVAAATLCVIGLSCALYSGYLTSFRDSSLIVPQLLLGVVPERIHDERVRRRAEKTAMASTSKPTLEFPTSKECQYISTQATALRLSRLCFPVGCLLVVATVAANCGDTSSSSNDTTNNATSELQGSYC
jgi:hypothetical protein